MIMEVGDSKTCDVSQQPGHPGQLMLQMKTRGSLLENSFLLREAGLFSSNSGLQLSGCKAHHTTEGR